MTETQPDDGMCHETSGFLFSHKCDRFSMQKCSTCLKPLCEEHGHIVPDGTLCTTCLKQKTMRERQSNQTDTDTTHYSHYDHYYNNDPYFYGTRYYPGYGHHSSVNHTGQTSQSIDQGNISGGDFSTEGPVHDPADFTEGDVESLRQEDDADFETDMGAS